MTIRQSFKSRGTSKNSIKSAMKATEAPKSLKTNLQMRNTTASIPANVRNVAMEARKSRKSKDPKGRFA